jgi:F420-0:gamma-glutamyl ligase-like protein
MTRGFVRCAVLLSFFLCLSAPGAVAQDAGRGLDVRVRELAGEYAVAGKQYVVLIAIDSYRAWNGLKNPVKDAKEIREILDRRYFVDEFIELFDADATKAGVNRLFGSLIARTSAQDSVLI